LTAARWCWFAHLSERASDAAAAVRVADSQGAPAGWLAAWPAGRKPVADAVRMDARLVDSHGDPAWVSLVLPGRQASPIFDDTAVSGALRAVLSGPPPDAVSTFVRDAVHFAGAVTVRRGDPWNLRDDPFGRVAPARILHGRPRPVRPRTSAGRPRDSTLLRPPLALGRLLICGSASPLPLTALCPPLTARSLGRLDVLRDLPGPGGRRG
jgi:hypothetical protein